MEKPNATREICSNEFSEAIASLVVNILICVVGTLSNALVCFTILRTPSLRTNCGYFVANLALVDLLVSITVEPLSAIVVLSTMQGHCALELRRTKRSLAYFMCSASLLNITFMSLDRCFAILSPLKYKARTTHRKVAISIAIIWTFAISCGLLEGLQVFSKEVCSILTQSMIGLMYIVIITSYAGILIKVRKQGKRRLHMQNIQSNQKNPYRTEWKTARIIVFITVIFTICWAPLAYALITIPEQTLNAPLFLWGSTVGIGSSAINPLVYFYSCTKFRKAAKKICWRRSLEN